MSQKTSVMVGMVIGSTIGGYVPAIWGDGFLSIWGIITTMIGGFAGIYIGYKLSQ